MRWTETEASLLETFCGKQSSEIVKAALNKLTGMIKFPLMVLREEIGVLNEKSWTDVKYEYETIT